MSDLRTRVIRLAYDNKGLRPHLLAALKEADFDAGSIGEEVGGSWVGDSDESYMKGEFTQGEFTELHDKVVGNGLGKAASDAEADLRKATIRLAHEKPHLRKHLLPLLGDK